jgi:integrase
MTPTWRCAHRTYQRQRLPRWRPNAELRRWEHLTETEVERLMEAAKGNRSGLRDATMVLVAYRHGLRASEPHSNSCYNGMRRKDVRRIPQLKSIFSTAATTVMGSRISG